MDSTREMSNLDGKFQDYFAAMDRAGGRDRCFICRRTPSEVKAFFGFDEDGVPFEAAEHGIEDVVFDQAHVMSYRATRPVCAVCQLNFDAIFMLDGHEVLAQVLHQMEHQRDELWPDGEAESPGVD